MLLPPLSTFSARVPVSPIFRAWLLVTCASSPRARLSARTRSRQLNRHMTFGWSNPLRRSLNPHSRNRSRRYSRRICSQRTRNHPPVRSFRSFRSFLEIRYVVVEILRPNVTILLTCVFSSSRTVEEAVGCISASVCESSLISRWNCMPIC